MSDISELRIADREHWTEGAPLDAFERMRNECPVHWSEGMTDYPEEKGFWSLTTQETIREVSRDYERFSSELGGMVGMPWVSVDIQNGMFIGMDPPKHGRLKSLFQKGFTPKRIAEHEDAIRAIVVARLDALEGDTCDLVNDIAQPIVSRVIGSFMGIDEADDKMWADAMTMLAGGDDPELNPDGVDAVVEHHVPAIAEGCHALIEDRRENPRDDLMSILVNAEIDGDRLTDWEIVMGFILLMVAGNDSTKATFCSGMKALMEHPEERQKVLDDLELVPSAVEEALRMYPAFAHFRRTATTDTEIGGCPIKAGDKIMMWYPSSGRDASVYENPDTFDAERNPEHQAFGAGGRHFCLGTALARLELHVMFEETLKRFPNMEIDGEPRYSTAIFLNQLTSLPVKLNR